MTLAATYDATNARVQLAATALPIMPGLNFFVERQVGGGSWVGVRGGYPIAPAAATFNLDDYEFTPNVVNSYRIRTDAIYDTFSRSSASAWGSADSGQAYTVSGGIAADYNVAAGIGTIRIQAVSAARVAFMNTVSLADYDQYADIASSATATGGSIFGRLNGRRDAGGSNRYFLEIEFQTTGGVILTLKKTVAGVQTTLASVLTTLSYTPGVTKRVRFRQVGSLLYLKAWDTTSVEPSTWTITATDTSVTLAGKVGAEGILAGVNTNVNPVVQFDNFHVLDLATTSPTMSIVGSTTITPTLTDMWLKFPLRPFLNRLVSFCNWDPETLPARGQVYEVLGRRLPVAVTEVRGSRRFGMTLATIDADEADGIALSLSFGDVAFIQSPGDDVYCALAKRNYPASLYAFIGDVNLAHPMGTTPPWVVDFPCTEVAPPDPALAGSGVTWQGIINGFATWAAVQAQFGTWLLVEQYISSPDDEIVG